MIKGFNHISLLVADAERSKFFYKEVLGLRSLSRPNLGFKGYWFSLGEGQSLHLLEVTDPYQAVQRPQQLGRDRHLALSVDRLDAAKQQLTSAKVKFTASQSGRAAIFFYDPDFNVIELTQI